MRLHPLVDGIAITLLRFAVMVATLELAEAAGVSGWDLGLVTNVAVTVVAVVLMTRRRLWRASVSSSPTDWVTSNLAHVHLDTVWDAIICADHDASIAKPNPHLYLAALETLGIKASEAIAFEDSPNGIVAAKAAGVFCVAVPNALTSGFDVGDRMWPASYRVWPNDPGCSNRAAVRTPLRSLDDEKHYWEGTQSGNAGLITQRFAGSNPARATKPLLTGVSEGSGAPSRLHAGTP